MNDWDLDKLLEYRQELWQRKLENETLLLQSVMRQWKSNNTLYEFEEESKFIHALDTNVIWSPSGNIMAVSNENGQYSIYEVVDTHWKLVSSVNDGPAKVISLGDDKSLWLLVKDDNSLVHHPSKAIFHNEDGFYKSVDGIFVIVSDYKNILCVDHSSAKVLYSHRHDSDVVDVFPFDGLSAFKDSKGRFFKFIKGDSWAVEEVFFYGACGNIISARSLALEVYWILSSEYGQLHTLFVSKEKVLKVINTIDLPNLFKISCNEIIAVQDMELLFISLPTLIVKKRYSLPEPALDVSISLNRVAIKFSHGWKFLYNK